MSASDTLRDEAIRHALHAADYDAETTARIGRLLNSADEDLSDTLAKRLVKIKERGTDLGPATTARLTDLLTETRAINEAVYSKVHTSLQGELVDRAGYEAAWAGTTLEKTLGLKSRVDLPPAPYLKQLVDTSPIDGHLLKSWTDYMGEARLGRVEKAIRVGLLQGENTDKIVARIMGTKAARYADGILQISRRSAQSLVLTASATVANNARIETYRRSGLIKAVKWIATLDTRTTDVCQSRDGTVYPIDEPFPQPPAHVRCRSILIPVTKSFRELGADRDEVAPGKRASMDGQVPGSTTMEDWVAAQPPERQAQALNSEARAELFRSGKVSWRGLFREDGSYRSVAELRATEGVVAAGSAAAATPEPEAAPRVDTAAIDERERDYVMRRGEETGVEHLVAYEESTGEVVERKQGDKSSVSFSDNLVRLLNDPANSIVLHHNHPSSSSLSLPDMQVITRRAGARSIWAHGRNGSSYYAERGAKAFSEKTANAVGEYFRKALQARVNASLVSVPDAQIIHNHLIWTAMHHMGQITYRAELRGTALKAWERNKVWFQKLLEALT